MAPITYKPKKENQKKLKAYLTKKSLEKTNKKK